MVLGISTALVIQFVDPNQFKEPIQKAIWRYNGHQLILQGPIHWKWYPMLSLELNEVDLRRSPSATNSLLYLQKIKVDLSWHALLKKRFALNFVATLPIGTLDGSLSAHFKANSRQLAFIDADISSHRLLIQPITINRLKARIHHENDQLIISPFNFEIAGAQQTADLKIILSPKAQWFLKQTGEPFEITKLLSSIDPHPKVAGRTKLDLELQGHGLNLAEAKKTLSGKAIVRITQGQFKGIDLIALLKQALSGVHDLINALTGQPSANSIQALNAEAKNWSFDHLNKTASTPFDDLSASINFTAGVGTNPDLRIIHRDYHIEGNGSLDLSSEKLHYKAVANLTQSPYPPTDDLGTYLFKMPVPVDIQGTLQNPSIRPDLNTYFNNTLLYVQKTKAAALLKQTLEHTLHKILKPNVTQSP